MNEIVLIAGMAFVTFTIRYSMVYLSSRFTMPENVESGLKFVPPAVLTAIILPSVLITDGNTLNLSLFNPYLIAVAAAALVSWFSKNLLATVVAGMIVFTVVRVFTG